MKSTSFDLGLKEHNALRRAVRALCNDDTNEDPHLQLSKLCPPPPLSSCWIVYSNDFSGQVFTEGMINPGSKVNLRIELIMANCTICLLYTSDAADE